MYIQNDTCIFKHNLIINTKGLIICIETAECIITFFPCLHKKGEHLCVKCVTMALYCRDVSGGRGKNKEIKNYISPKEHIFCVWFDNQIKRRRKD